jgi:hypothetical protein
VYKNTAMRIGQAAAQRLALPGSALLALFVGTSVYLFDRDWATVRFLAPLAALQGEQANFFGALGQVLPAVCHAYAFTLFLILVLGRSRRARVLGAFGWFVLAAGLEVLQAERVSAALSGLAALLPESQGLSSSINYAVNGCFDPGDLLAAALGCAAAFLVASVPEAET